jgi:hypothetical protein
LGRKKKNWRYCLLARKEHTGVLPLFLGVPWKMKVKKRIFRSPASILPPDNRGLNSGFTSLVKFAKIYQNSTDSVVADFSEFSAVHSKFNTVYTKFNTVHPKFDIKFEFGHVQILSADKFLNPASWRTPHTCGEHVAACTLSVPSAHAAICQYIFLEKNS